MKPANSTIALIAGLTVAGSFFFASNVESIALELSIVESGSDSNPEIGLWVRDFGDSFFDVNRLVSPSGEVFTPDAVLDGDHIRSLLLRFSSLSDAMDYVDGAWFATPAQQFPNPLPAFEPYEFDIDAIPLDSINRTAPTLVSPTPSATIKNGTTFIFGWDYLTSDEAPNRTIFTRTPLFEPISSWGGGTVSTPRPGRTIRSSGSSGTGDRKFSTSLTNVPGTDKNRFLLTLTAAEAALPLEVVFTLGSYYSSSSVFPSSRVRFYYSRESDPFTITLATVPEPTSLGLTVVLAMTTAAVATRPARTAELRWPSARNSSSRSRWSRPPSKTCARKRLTAKRMPT